MKLDPAEPPLLALCANAAWNLVNFRADLICALRLRGFRLLAIAPPDPEMETRLAELGCEFEPVHFDAMGLSPLRDLATTAAMVRVLRKYRPRALLSWTIKPNIYGGIAARLYGVRSLPNISGLGTAFIRRNPLTRLVELLYRIGLSAAATVFFQNADDRDTFLKGHMVRSDQARLLPGSGIDTNHWSPPVGERPAKGHFLMISRVVADKGVREFVTAARQVRARHPSARFILMGPLEVANRTVIPRDEVEEWIAEGLIEHRPPVTDVRPAIAAADFVVLPSYREGLSRVLLEAAAMARPIITTNVPGCREVVEDGVNGFLCAARDGPSLAQAMESALELDDEAWQKMGKAGREKVVSTYAAERVIALYCAALDDALAGSRLAA